MIASTDDGAESTTHGAAKKLASLPIVQASSSLHVLRCQNSLLALSFTEFRDRRAAPSIGV